MTISLSRFSIRQQILIGFIPVLIILCFLGYSSYQNFQKFNRSFIKLQEITQENLLFREIETDLVLLQRNILVYSYVGYTGVLRKIEFLQNNLEEKFEIIGYLAEQDAEINDRYQRILGQYKKYKNGFQDAIQEKQYLSILTKEKMNGLITNLNDQLVNVQNDLIKENNYKAAFELGEIRNDLFITSYNIKSFEKSPDSLIINETRDLIIKIKKEANEIIPLLESKDAEKNLESFLEIFLEYENTFKNITRANRTYMNLINVVLAGQAAEIDKLADELDSLITKRSHILAGTITNNIKKTQSQFILLSFFTGLIGCLSCIIIATGIAKPVNAMAQTLYDLSLGKSDTEIPGLNRKDEVGKMAIAANEFKVMAKNLESQTVELEEFSYRTSHDLRSPLVSSISLLDLSQEALGNGNYERASKSMELVKTSLVKLETLVQDILQLTKTKNFIEEKQEVNLNKIINTSLEKLSHMEEFKNLSIEKKYNFNEPLKLQSSRLILILDNLLSNAVKYQDPSKDQSFLKITTHEEKNDVYIEVEDNGLGIPKDLQKQMFTMFKRFHPKVSFGSGLGLYMIKKSVDVLNGQIIFEDTGRGSKFILKIPARIVNE